MKSQKTINRLPTTHYSLLTNNGGFSLIETIVYISVLTMVMGIFTMIVMAVSNSYTQIAIIRNLDTAAVTSMERITRSIRSSSVVVSPTASATSSVLNLTQPDLVTNLFQISNQNIQIKVNDTDQGTLLPPEVIVTKLIFTLADSGVSKAVKIEMQLRNTSGGETRTETYYDTVILRGSYQ